MNAILQDLPLPARLLPWPAALPTTLARCVLLALLVHVWLLLLLGNAPSGTAAPGKGVGGAINVTLRGPVSEGARAVPMPHEPLQAPNGSAATPRWGGAVRESEAAPATEPGATRLGEPALRPSEQAQAAAPTVPVPPATPAPPAPPAQAQQDPAPAAPVLERQLSAPPALAAAQAPLAPSPPAVQPLPLPALAQPTAVVAASPAERQLGSALMQLPAAPAAARSPLRPSTAVALPELAAPAALADAPAPLRRLHAAPTAARPAEPDLPHSAEAPVSTPTPTPASALPSMPAPQPQAPPSAGAADAGSRVGHDLATPAAAAASTPRLNLQLARPRGGELSRTSTGGVLPVLPRPPERDDKLARDIDKAGKTECRNAYSALGPLALIPLALDAVRKEGACKW